jgi:hypothetical protein
MKTKLVIFGLTGDLGRRKLLPTWEILQPALDFWQNSNEETLRF